MPKKKKNYVPTKNYFITFIICAMAILLTYYLFSWYNVYQTKKYNESYLLSSKTVSLEVNDLNEIETTFKESPNEYFIFIGYLNDEDEYKFEKSLKKVIDSYDLNDLFYYIDATELKEDSDYLNKLNDSLKLEETKLASIPAIIYIKNGEVVKDGILTKENANFTNASDFEKLLEMYEFKKVSK